MVGQREKEFDKNVVNRLRGVYAREYAGGFFGLADVGGVAEVSESGTGGTSILQLIQLGNVSVLDAFRTYIYYSEANGLSDGLRVLASEQEQLEATLSYYLITGAAGGFGGWMNNGTIEHSSTTNLSYVEAKNYAAGFVGYLGKNKAVDVSGTQLDTTLLENIPGIGSLLSPILELLGTGLNLGALDVVGSTVTECSVSGYGTGNTNIGFDVKTTNTQEATSSGSSGTAESDLPATNAAGFVGYGDIAQIEDCTVDRLKKVSSQQIAGGFLGRGTYADLIDLELNNDLINLVLRLVTFLVVTLGLGDLANSNLIDLDQFDYLGLRLFSDGDLLMLNLLGLRIGVSTGQPDLDGNRTVTIYIGSSSIVLTADKNGNIIGGDNGDDVSALTLSLFEANRTTVKNCSVTGVIDGYDVHGDGYVESKKEGLDNDDSGTRNNNYWGFAGGFVGYHERSFFSGDEMIRCDVVAGDDQTYRLQVTSSAYVDATKVGPFTGGYRYNPNTGNRNINYFEGAGAVNNNDNQNIYHIYRNVESTVDTVLLDSVGQLKGAIDSDTTYMRYNVQHRVNSSSYSDGTAAYNGVYQFSKNHPAAGTNTYLEDARYALGGSASEETLDAYISDGKAKLMLGTILEENTPHVVLPPIDLNDPCEDIDLTIVKQWDHKDDPEAAWPSSVTFDVYQVIGTESDRDLVSMAESAPDGSRYMGSYTLTTADQVAIGLDQIKELWSHTYTEPAANRDDAPDWYEWGTAADLATVLGRTGENVVFMATTQDPATARVLTDANGLPVHVGENPEEVKLYSQTNHADKFVVGENVQLWYKDGDNYYPAFSYRLDADNNYSYSNAASMYSDLQLKQADGTTPVTATVGGETCDVYVVKKVNDRPAPECYQSAGDVHSIAEAEAAGEGTELIYIGQTSKQLRKYTYVTPEGTLLDFFFDDSGALTSAQERHGGATDAITLTAAENNYTWTGATADQGKGFRISYNPNTGLLQLDYDIHSADNDGVIREEEMASGEYREVFGYNANNELVRYKYIHNVDTLFTIRFDPAATSGTQTVRDENGATYTVTYSDTGAVVNGTDAQGKRFVVTYEKADRHLILYYDLATPTLDGVEFEDVDVFKTKNQLYGMDATGALTVFQFHNPDAANDEGFQLFYTSGTGTVIGDADIGTVGSGDAFTSAGSATVTSLSGNRYSFESDGYRYTVKYDPSTRLMQVNYVTPKTVNGRDVYYYTEITNDDGSVDALWMDADGEAIRLARTVSGQTLTVDFNTDGSIASASDTAATTDPLTVETNTVQEMETISESVMGSTVTIDGHTCDAYKHTVSKETVFTYVDGGGNRQFYDEQKNRITDADALETARTDFNDGKYEPTEVMTGVTTYQCAVYRKNSDGTLLYYHSSSGAYFNSSKQKLTAAQAAEINLASDYTRVTTTQYVLRDGGAAGRIQALVRNNGSNIQVDYRTPGLLAGGDIVYAETMTDDNGATHTFYYNAAGDLVRYDLRDPDGATMTRSFTPNTVLSTDGGVTTYGEKDYSASATYGSGERYYLEYIESEEANGNTVDVRRFTVSYDLPDEYPTVFMAYPDPNSTVTRAYFDENGNLYKFLYSIPNSRGAGLALTYTELWGAWNNIAGSDAAFEVILDPDTGLITEVNLLRVDENGNMIADWARVNRYKAATGDPGVAGLEVAYKHVAASTGKDKTYYISYDPVQRAFYVNELQKNLSVPGVVYWASFADDDDNGYTYIYGFNSDKEPIYLQIQKGNNKAEFNIDPTTGAVTEVPGSNSIGDSFKITYDPSTRLVKIERYDSSTNLSFASDAEDPVVVNLYYNWGFGTSRNETFGFDQDGRLRHYHGDDYAATEHMIIDFWLNEDGTLDTSKPYSAVRDGTSYSYNSAYNSLSAQQWSYSWNGDSIRVRYLRNNLSTGDENWTAGNGETNLKNYVIPAPSATAYFDLSDYPASYTFPATFSHDFTTTLARPGLSHEVAVSHSPDYEYRLPLPDVTQEHFLEIPNAAQTHNLAKLIGEPEYIPIKATAYYRYVVVERSIPNYEIVEGSFAWRSDTSTVTVKNEYKGKHKIVVDKYDYTDASQKLAGATFKLFRFATDEEIAEHAGDATPWTELTKLYYHKDESTSEVTWITDATQATEYTTDTTGFAEFTGIDPMDDPYYLEETAAPPGYVRIETPIPVYVPQITAENLSAAEVEMAKTHVAHIPNSPRTILPPTGGPGTATTTTAGILLLIGAAYLMLIFLRKRKERGTAET